MTSIFRIFFRDFQPPATVENLGATPVPAPAVKDLAEFDRDIEELFDRGQERIRAEEGATTAT
jgi:hypothetical protein